MERNVHGRLLDLPLCNIPGNDIRTGLLIKNMPRPPGVVHDRPQEKRRCTFRFGRLCPLPVVKNWLRKRQDLEVRQLTIPYLIGTFPARLGRSRNPVPRVTPPVRRLSPEILSRARHFVIPKQKVSTPMSSELSYFKYPQATLRASLKARGVRSRDLTLGSMTAAHLRKSVSELAHAVTTDDIAPPHPNACQPQVIPMPTQHHSCEQENNPRGTAIRRHKKQPQTVRTEGSYVFRATEIDEHRVKPLGRPTPRLRGNGVSQTLTHRTPLTHPIFLRQGHPRLTRGSFEYPIVGMRVRRMKIIDIHSRRSRLARVNRIMRSYALR